MKNKNIPVHKVCWKCKIDKVLEEFSNDKSRKDGKMGKCKICERNYRQDNKKTLKTKAKRRYEDNREENLIKAKRRYEDNREENLIKAKQYRQENKEEIAVKDRQRRQENKEILAITRKQYSQTSAGKEAQRKARANRNRDLGWVSLNKIFDGSNGHHIDYDHVIYIPEEMHRPHHCLRGENAGFNLDHMNNLAFEYLFDNTDGLIVPVEFAVELRDSLLN